MTSSKTSRGRPPRTSAQVESDRCRVIEAARTLFAEDGYTGVSMRKIADQSGCSPAALYKLFASKRVLLRHIWEGVFTDLAVVLEGAYEHNDPGHRLEALCIAYVDFWLNRPDDFRSIFLVEDQLQGQSDEYFVDSSAAVPRLNILKQCVIEAQNRGELRPDDPDLIRSVLLSGAQGVCLNLITIPEYPWGDAQSLKCATVDALLSGLQLNN